MINKTKSIISANCIFRLSYLTRNFRRQPVDIIDDKHLSPMQAETQANNSWLNELHQHFHQHISEPSFTQEQLARLMNISTRQLNRKLKQLTGQKPNHYLKNLRYQAALLLLQQKRYATVAETAYAVGLKDVVYFSRQFRIKYGKLPSEYLKNF